MRRKAVHRFRGPAARRPAAARARVTATEAAAITVIAVAGEVRWAMVPASVAATPCMVSIPEECRPSA